MLFKHNFVETTYLSFRQHIFFSFAPVYRRRGFANIQMTIQMSNVKMFDIQHSNNKRQNDMNAECQIV